MSSLTAVLVIIQQNTIRYGFPIILIFGNLGNLFSIIIFSQRRHRTNPCSLYLLASTVISLIGLNWGFGTNLNALYQSPDPFTISLILCRTRGYILQTTSVMYRSMIILACMDRYALSSARPNIRAYSTTKFALKMILGTIIFAMIVSIHLPIFQIIQNNRYGVYDTYGLFFSIYQIFLFGIVFPCLMIIFGFLLWKNLKTIRIRVHRGQRVNNSQPQLLNKRDVNLMRFVLAEILTAILLTSLYPINTTYTTLTSNILKSQERLQIEGFINFVIMLLLFYLNYCMTFYLYIFTSKSFRREIKRLLLRCFNRTVRPETNNIPRDIQLRTRKVFSLMLHINNTKTYIKSIIKNLVIDEIGTLNN